MIAVFSLIAMIHVSLMICIEHTRLQANHSIERPSRIQHSIANRITQWKAVGLLMGLTICMVYALRPQLMIYASLSCIILAGLAAVQMITFNHEGWNTSLHSATKRLTLLGQQLDKLQLKTQLHSTLTKTSSHHQAFQQFSSRFELILWNIENHLLLGEHQRAERIITLFARHLRQILYEGYMPFIPLRECIEHATTYLNLMQLLTGDRFKCDIDDGMLDDQILDRCVESMLITPWIQDAMWSYFALAERSLEFDAQTVLNLDVNGSDLEISFNIPDSPYLPENTHTERIHTRIKILGDPDAVTQPILNRVALSV